MAKEYTEENVEDKVFSEKRMLSVSYSFILNYSISVYQQKHFVLIRNISLFQSVEKDFMWWYNNRRVKVIKNQKEYMMFRYHHVSTDPRPENYKLASHLEKTIYFVVELYFFKFI